MQRGPNQPIAEASHSGSKRGHAAPQSAPSTRMAAPPVRNRQTPNSSSSTRGAPTTTAAGRLNEAQTPAFWSAFTLWLTERVNGVSYTSRITSRADICRIKAVLKGEVAKGTQSSVGRSYEQGVFVCRIALGVPHRNRCQDYSCGVAVVKSDYHIRNKYQLVLVDGDEIISDIKATERKRKAIPGTCDICVPLAWEEYFDVLLKTHEEMAHMLTGTKLHDKVKGSSAGGSSAPIGRRADLVLRRAAIRVCHARCVRNSSRSALSATKG